MKVILHLDLDSYFVSAERVVDHSLKGKPVVIASRERRSIISAASYEAKSRGVYVPMPFYKALELIPEIIAVKPDFALYTNLSSKVFELISKEYTDQIEVGSIDECYIDATKIWKKYGSPIKLAKHIQGRIFKKLDLPASIGISNNKFVAKMSTSINKPFGITVTKPGDFLDVMGDWEIIKYFGIGASTAAKLNKINIFSIKDLAKADKDDLKEMLGITGPRLIWQANGNGDEEINIEHNELKGIGNSLTFQKFDKFERKDILDTLAHLTRLVAQRLITRNMVGKVISVAVKSTGGKEIKAKTKQVTLIRPVQTFEEIFAEVRILFDSLWDENPIKFVGVNITKLEDIFESSYQMGLWDEKNEKSKIEEIIDHTNRQLKTKAVMSGREARMNIKRSQNQSRYIESDRILKHYDDDMKKR